MQEVVVEEEEGLTVPIVGLLEEVSHHTNTPHFKSTQAAQYDGLY